MTETDILGLAAAALGADRQRELPVGMVPQHVVHLVEDHQASEARKGTLTQRVIP